jgi:hypothetical protein
LTTESETLPMSALLSAPRPRLPITIRPTPRPCLPDARRAGAATDLLEASSGAATPVARRP